MQLLRKIFYVLLFIFGLSFAVLNATVVPVNLYFIKLAIPLPILMIVMLVLGLFLGLISCLHRYFRLKKEYFKIKNQLRLNEKEIRNLRAIPLQDQH